jgi:acid phosphatase class B
MTPYLERIADMKLALAPLSAMAVVLASFALGGCSDPAAADDNVEAAGGSEDALTSNGTAYSFQCTNKDGGAKTTVAVSANGANFDVTASANGAVVVQATAQRPSLNVRPNDAASDAINEFIDWSDAGLDVVPVDGPKALELDLAGAKTLLYKDPQKTVTFKCSFDKAKLLRLLKFNLVSHVDMKNVKVVAFDIDDTLAFTTPTFTRAFATGGTPDPHDTTFWTQTNGCDNGCPAQTLTLPDGTTKQLPENVASTAKQRALDMIALHKSHGHRIYAVTARPDINGDPLRDYIERELGIAKEDVFFEPDIDQPGNPAGKTDRLKSLDIDVFYGDSDSDITDTNKAFLDASGHPTKRVQAVRFFRSPNSSNRKAGKLNKYHPGYYGEPIISGSYE